MRNNTNLLTTKKLNKKRKKNWKGKKKQTNYKRQQQLIDRHIICSFRLVFLINKKRLIYSKEKKILNNAIRTFHVHLFVNQNTFNKLLLFSIIQISIFKKIKKEERKKKQNHQKRCAR